MMTNYNPMRAQTLKEFGPANTAFNLQRVSIPEIEDNQVLIRVSASSVNPVDCKIRSGLYSIISPDSPHILHGDVAGTVVKVGKSVTQFKLDDELYGCAGGFKGTQGALAEYMVVDPDLMSFKPKSLSAIESAVLPLVSITAWLALIERVQIKAGQTVLIHGASGGVGSLALQLAIYKGAKTYVTTSSVKKGEFARQCGAVVINYQSTAVENYVHEHTSGEGFDVVFDTVGGDNLVNSIAALKINGSICSVAASSVVDLSPLYKKGGTLHYIFMPAPLLNVTAVSARQGYGQILSEIAKLVDHGYIKPLIGATINFSEIAEAHKLQEEGAVIGKIVLKQDLKELT